MRPINECEHGFAGPCGACDYRPAKPRPEPLTEMVCVRMTAATKARLTREGALQGRSNPDLGRIAIEQMLDAQDTHRMQEATRV